MEGREDMSTILEPEIKELVNREPQIEQLNKGLNDIKRQSAQANLREYVGGPGIGKTQLIKLLQQECNSASAPWVSINFKEADQSGHLPHYLQDPTKLIEDMTLDLTRKVNLSGSPVQEMIEAYRQNKRPDKAAYFNLSSANLMYEQPAWIGQLRQVIRAFLDLLKQIHQTGDAGTIRPVVFFFDETEYAPTELVDWLEEWVISPVVSLKNCLVIWTSRSQQAWKTPYIKRLVQSESLPPFKLEETEAQLRQRNVTSSDLAAEFFSQVYEVTQGHPAANAFAINQIGRWSDNSPEQVKAALLEDIFENFIRDYVFSSLKERDERIACELVAMVRSFDSVMLRNLLQAMREKEFKDKPAEYFEDLLQRLKRTPFLTWEKGYALEKALRPLIRNYYATCQRDEYIKLHKTARDVYRHWLVKKPDNPNFYIVEELYHTACLQQTQVPDAFAETLSEILKKRVQAYWQQNVDEELRKHVLERLKDELERDAELNKLAEGLTEQPLSQYVDVVLQQSDAASIAEDIVSVVTTEAV